MTVLLWEIVGSLIRAGAAMLSGYLISHHLLTADKADTFTSELTTHVLLALPIVGAVAWSIWQKYAKQSTLGKVIDQVADMKAAQQRTSV